MKKPIPTIFFLFFVLISLFTQAQMRTKNTKYLEFSGGLPLLFGENQSLEFWKKGERVFGLGLCFTNAKSNYHRIQVGYREEKVLDSPAFYTNTQMKYSYESTLLKGKYHRSFFGLLYGAGIGCEQLIDSPNINLTADKFYPLVTLGINFEKYVLPPFALFVRVETDFTTSNISQLMKANTQIGLKFSISNGQ
jgi:hypothetical protein